MTTVAASKTISFKAPYTGATFQGFTNILVGRDGFVSGGLTTDNGVTITVEPTTFIQRGLVVSSLADATGIPVPTAAEPWFVIAATPDDDPDSGAVFTATADLGTAANSVVVATRMNGVWVNPSAVNVAGAAERASDSGWEGDLGLHDVKNAGGVVTSMVAYKGLVVDPSGRRLGLRNIPTNSAQALAASPARPNIAFDRDDHVVLRQVEPFSSEMKTIIGGAMAPTANAITLDSGVAVTRAAYFAKRGGAVGEQWWAWGDAADLNIKGGPAGEAFAAAVLLTGTSITQTWIGGQRASDSAVVVLYIDGANLRMVSFNATTGVQVDAPVTLEALSGQISHIGAVLDRNEKLHICFEHDEGPRQQVYYTKVGISAGAGFGVAEVSPQIVNGTDSGLNDTWPSIGVDRRGTVTIAHIRGAGSDEFGNLIVATIDAQGDTVSQDVVLAANDVGIDDGDPGPGGVVVLPGRGAVQTAMNNVRQTSVVVTPHDEVYVFTIGFTASLRRFILAYGPQFEREHGHKLLNILPRLISGDQGYVTIAADVGEAGEIFLAYKKEDLVTPETDIETYTFPTPLFTSGRMSTPLWQNVLDTNGSTDSFNDIYVRRGPLGEFIVSYRLGTASKTRQCAAYGSPIGGYGLVTWPVPQRHPKDLYLGTWSVPKSASATLDGYGKRFQVFNTRPKKMNYPVVVGQNGDYQGFNSIAEAWTKVSRSGGGDVVLRSGIHRVTFALGLYGGGVSVRGEGSAVVIAEGATGFCTAGGISSGPVTVSASGNVITDSGYDLMIVRAGDVINMDISGRHVVLRNLGPDSGGFPTVLLENNASGPPVGTTAQHYASGVRFENLDVRLLVASTFPFAIAAANRPILRNITLSGPTTTGLILAGCLDPLVDGLDLTKVVNTDANLSFWMAGCESPVVRGARFADGKGKFQIDSNSQNVTLIDVTSDGADATKVIFDITAGRTTPIFMTNCEGRITGAPADIAYLITNVGKRMRLPEGGGALELEDDNTRASTITDDGIKLTSATHKQFDGVSTDTITDAVNERVKVGGDVMTGLLEIGTAFLGTEANALMARVKTGFSIVVNTQYTLIWEGTAAAQKGLRLYAGDLNSGAGLVNPGLLFTVNASFDGTNWNKDVNGIGASGFFLTYDTVGDDVFKFVTQAPATNTWTQSGWRSDAKLDLNAALTLYRDNGAGDVSTLNVAKLSVNTQYGPDTAQLFHVNLGYDRRGRVFVMEDSEITGVQEIDQHGRVHTRGWLVEDDFDQTTIGGKFVKQDITAVGSATNPNGRYLDLQTAGSAASQTIIRNHGSAYWSTGSGVLDLGFRMRLRCVTITNSIQFFGFWDNSTFNPNNDNAINGFVVEQGVVYVIWTENGGTLHKINTGVTVTASQMRWYSWYWHPVNGILRWHISGASGDVGDYVGSGTLATDYPVASDQSFLYAGCFSVAPAVCRLFIDYIAGWSSTRYE